MAAAPADVENADLEKPLAAEADPLALDRRAFVRRLGAGNRRGRARRRRTGSQPRPKPPAPRPVPGPMPRDGRRRTASAWTPRSWRASGPSVAQSPNGDEDRYTNRIASYSKGLPHDGLGEVDPRAYDTLLRAFRSGDPSDFERINAGARPEADEPAGGPRVRSRRRRLAPPLHPGRAPLRRRRDRRRGGRALLDGASPGRRVHGLRNRLRRRRRRGRSVPLLDLQGPEVGWPGDARDDLPRHDGG